MEHVREFPADLRGPSEAIARTLGVTAAIHAADHIFWWQYDDPTQVDKLSVAGGYLAGGAATAEAFKALIGQYRPTDAPFTMLEFASGYGRVTRHWRNVLPCADVLACDIHADAVAALGHTAREAEASASLGTRVASLVREMSDKCQEP